MISLGHAKRLRCVRLACLPATAALSVCAVGIGFCSEQGAARPADVWLAPSAPEGTLAKDGTCHVVKPGHTLYSISRAYRVPLEILAEVNGIEDPSRIQSGRVLFVPGAAGPLEIAATFPPHLIWPLSGMVTSSFGSEGAREHHEGIDIDGLKGQMIRAAAAGRVVWAGSERGYGNMVVIDHGNGLSTLYAHASRLLVGTDEWVDSGEPVAEVGDTGNARGSHLHFEVRRNGQPVDPLPVLGTSIVRASRRR